jgi:carboxynorspermidine decarboxylase
VVDRGLLARNLQVLDLVQQRTGARIILALKGFAMFSLFPQIREVLQGTTASSLNEARLGQEEFGKEVHVYAVAYRDHQFDEISRIAHHITFNSFSQWRRFREQAKGRASCGIRLNPQYSEVATEIYNPCRPGSRFGMTAAQFKDEDITGIEGLHFHTLCEQNSDTLARTLQRVEEDFAPWLHQVTWLNMGGGHHISRPDYDVDLLCSCIARMRDRYGLTIYLEPGEAIALNTGFLVSSVVDRFRSGEDEIGILDTSATAHMPDVLEMPYRPQIIGAGEPGERAHTVTLGGMTCLAGDILGAYSFDQPLTIGDRVVFTDMAHYTMVKNSTFNGVDLPAIAIYDGEKDDLRVVREFGYEDYRDRLS